jgi:hypothetical protein
LNSKGRKVIIVPKKAKQQKVSEIFVPTTTIGHHLHQDGGQTQGRQRVPKESGRQSHPSVATAADAIAVADHGRRARHYS